MPKGLSGRPALGPSPTAQIVFLLFTTLGLSSIAGMAAHGTSTTCMTMWNDQGADLLEKIREATMASWQESASTSHTSRSGVEPLSLWVVYKHLMLSSGAGRWSKLDGLLFTAHVR